MALTFKEFPILLEKINNRIKSQHKEVRFYEWSSKSLGKKTSTEKLPRLAVPKNLQESWLTLFSTNNNLY